MDREKRIGRGRRYLSVALLAALVGVTAVSVRAQAEEGPLSPVPERRVFAHYMTAYGHSVEFYKREIELAQRHGIEGFALNCGEWLRLQGGEWGESRYVPSAERMFQAALELDSGFMLFFSPDPGPQLRDIPRQMLDMIERFQDHPNQFRYRGKPVISSWGGSLALYRRAIEALEEAGHEVIFVPYIFSGQFNHAMAWSPQRVLDFIDHDFMDGLYNFGIDSTVNEIIKKNAVGRQFTLYRDKLFMAGAGPAYNSANMRNMRGMEGYGAIWRGIIRDRADWVELVTWNDYNEDSNLMPYRWSHPRAAEKDYFVRDESYLDVTAYYSAWFKSGEQPAVTQDKVYFSYRNRSKYLTRVWDPARETWTDVRGGQWPLDQIHDDAKDEIYVTTMLTAPAELVVRLAGREHVFEQPAGIAHATVALVPGLPEFALRRDGNELASVAGRREIVGEDDLSPVNSRRGYHLVNRTWTGALAVGDASHVAIADGEGRLAEAGDAVAVDVSSAVDGNATFNIRITYVNPDTDPARVTLVADGMMEGEDEGYYIPVFLPPTGGEARTVSFFWSLYAETTTLRLEHMVIPGNLPRRLDHAWTHDYGDVTVQSLTLVPVDPVAMPAPVDRTVPELVAIPGGTFAMGSETGEPDERPVRTVTVGDFAIGKYEVTNEQYERFDPDHRKFRDGYSWRDREPVIYVSWQHAVQYCNWLSEQHGLTPAYEQQQFEAEVEIVTGHGEVRTRTVSWRDWVLVEGADGFRLPTEAQWEYVASGRGEGRIYPWGNEEPIPGVHGNFQGAAALEIKPALQAQPGVGVMEVGRFPQGASRDGVMDMAGNVSEWTHDPYVPTGGDGSAKFEVEPGVWTQERYRTLRGGSWGYYNHSQRVADREFNTIGYGGYIYLGFRVALPPEGYAKLAGL